MLNLAEALLMAGVSDEFSLLPEELRPDSIRALLPGRRIRCWVRGLDHEGELGRHNWCWFVYDSLEHPESEPVELEVEDGVVAVPSTLLIRGAVVDKRPKLKLGDAPPGVPLYYFTLYTETLEVEFISRYVPEPPEEAENAEGAEGAETPGDAESPQDAEDSGNTESAESAESTDNGDESGKAEEPEAEAEPQPDGLSDDERRELAEEWEEPDLGLDEPAEGTLWGYPVYQLESEVALSGHEGVLARTYDSRLLPVPDLIFETEEGEAVDVFPLRPGGQNRVFAPMWEEGQYFKVKVEQISPKAVMKGIPEVPWAPPPETAQRVYTVTVDRVDRIDKQTFWVLKVEDRDTLPDQVSGPAYEMWIHRGTCTLYRVDSVGKGGVGGSVMAGDPRTSNLFDQDVAFPWLYDLLPWPPYVPASEDKPYTKVIKAASDKNQPVELRAIVDGPTLLLECEDPVPPEEELPVEEIPERGFRWVQEWSRWAPWPVSTRKEGFDPYSGDASKTDFVSAELLEAFPPPPPEEEEEGGEPEEAAGQ